MKKIRQIMKIAGVLSSVFLLTITMKQTTFAAETLEGYSAWDIVHMMSRGYNIGNTLEARDGKTGDVTSQETSWGNPVITQELMDSIKAAGFDTVRIPITWFRFVDKEDGYAIDPAFMARIKEVVDYAYQADLFVVINTHHESWLEVSTLKDDYAEISKELAAIWSQVAEEFAEYDQHLIFEGMNEPRAKGTDYEWTGTADEYAAINYLNQVFVTTVRDNGKGNNGNRVLVIPGYAASSSSQVIKSIEIPTYKGAPAENVAVSFHCYSPYEFCLTDNQPTFNATNPSDTGGITAPLKLVKELFLDNGIPVYVGECGCTNNHDNLNARIDWFNYFGKKINEYGVPAFVWDNGSNTKRGGESHVYIDRKTAELVQPELIQAFIYGYEPEPEPASDIFIDFEPKQEGDSTVMVTPKEAGFTSALLKGQAKVNHTPDVSGLGFAMKVQNVEEDTAYWDVTKYVDLNIKVSAWIYSEDDVTVTAGLGEFVASAHSNGEWQEIVFGAHVTADDQYIFFTGESGKVFYIDDFSIEIVDSLDGIVSTSAGELSDSNAGDAEANLGSDSSNQEDSGEDSIAFGDEEPDNLKTVGFMGKVFIILAILVVVAVIGSVVALGRKKSK